MTVATPSPARSARADTVTPAATTAPASTAPANTRLEPWITRPPFLSSSFGPGGDRPKARRLALDPAAGFASLHHVQRPGSSPTRPLVIAHRGASGYAPEHTFAAWDLALDMGADYLEQDLQMTADGHLVVLHDETLDRTATGCTGLVRTKTLAQIENCDVGSWFNRARPELARPEFERQRLPTLDAVLGRYNGRARFYIETKKPDAAPGMEEALLRLLDRHGLRPADNDDTRVIVQSFSARSLQKLHALEPRLFLVQLFHSRIAGWIIRGRLRRTARWACGIGPSHRCVDARLMNVARALGLHVHPWTVNDAPTMRRLLELGVHGMFTDLPDRLLEVLRGPEQAAD